jgi:hypothetical protein
VELHSANGATTYGRGEQPCIRGFCKDFRGRFWYEKITVDEVKIRAVRNVLEEWMGLTQVDFIPSNMRNAMFARGNFFDSSGDQAKAGSVPSFGAVTGQELHA